MDPGTAGIVLIVLIIGLGAFVHGYGGFGYGMVAMSLFALLPYRMEPVTGVVTAGALVLLVVLLRISRPQGGIHWTKAGLILLGVVAGTPLGYLFIMKTGDSPAFRVALGAFLVVAGVVGALGVRARRKPPGFVGPLVGVLGGFLSGAFVTGGPPLVLYLYALADDAREMKATVQCIFIVMVIYRLTLVRLMGERFTAPVVVALLAALPLTVIAVVLGHKLSRADTARRFRVRAHAIIALFGLIVVTRALW